MTLEQMYIAETKCSVEDATNWLKFEHGKWLPHEDKAIRYLKWFHDGVLAHKDKGAIVCVCIIKFTLTQFNRQHPFELSEAAGCLPRLL